MNKNRPAYGLYDKVIEIERWFHEERQDISSLLNTNTPLVIVGPEGSGRTSLLFQWMEFHEAKSQFFTNITLFDLNMRIEMQNDKIRTFFFRWLELADQKKKFGTTDKCKVMLVIDGIDRLEMEEHQQQYQSHVLSNLNTTPLINYKVEEEPPDWFPYCFPHSFRVILTCKQNSKAYTYFKNMKVPFRFLYIDDPTNDTLSQIVEAHFSTASTYDSEDEIEQIKTLSKTGLKKEELKDCLEVKIEKIEMFLKIFQFVLLEYKNLYRVNNEQYKKTIEKLYLQEELYKNEIHSSIVAILSKTKHFNQNARLIDEVTYNIFRQGNQWLKLKDLLSNLEIFCHLFKPQDKYILALYWQKLEQHGFDPVYEYNKTMEAYVLNYFPTSSELFVVLTQLARFFKEFGDLETKCTAEFRHPPLVVSPELKKIKLSRELRRIGGMLVENKESVAALANDEKYSCENYLFMQLYREKQVQLLNKETPLFPSLQLYYYKRWIWLQFPWFCMDINSSYSAYMKKTIGKSIHLHMDTKNENDLALGSLRIIKEAKSRKQGVSKGQIYQVPEEFCQDDEKSENSEIKEGEENEDTKISISDDDVSLISKRDAMKSSMQSTRKQSMINIQVYPQSQQISPLQGKYNSLIQNEQEQAQTFRINRPKLLQTQSQSRLSSAAQDQRPSILSSLIHPHERRSQYSLAKSKWIDQDFELANIKTKLKPENAVRIVANQIKNYERKELETALQGNKELVNEYNRIAFEIQQKEKIYQSLQNCIIQLDTNNKENQAYEKKFQQIQEKLESTKQCYRISRIEQNRLKHIVNYCFKNKADNHEWIQGLERAVKNMVTLIKHEKESIINAKNLVIQMKKESKELQKLKNEKKYLQQMTTESMYGMINEKQNIKAMRELFEKRKDAVLRTSNIGELELTTMKSQESNFLQLSKMEKQPSSSPFSHKKSIKKMSFLNTERTVNTNDSPTKIIDPQQDINAKLEIIRQIAGAKSIDDYQQIIDFYENFQQLQSDRDFKERKIKELKHYKEQLLKELGQFHNKDIDKSNNKYEPHRLYNDIQNEIIQSLHERNKIYDIYKNSRNQLIEIRIMIEEMRKKMGLNISVFKKKHQDIIGEDLVKQMVEIYENVENKRIFIEDAFGTSKFSEIMTIIQEINPEEMRIKFLQSKKRSRQPSISLNQRINSEMRTHDGVFEDLQENELYNVRFLSNTDHKRQETQDFNKILIEDGTQEYNTKLPYLKNESKTSKKSRRSSRSNQAYEQQQQKVQFAQQSSTQNINNYLRSESLNQLYKYQIPSAILDQTIGAQSILAISKPQKDKETIFYKRVDEMEKEQDVIKTTYQAILDFKKQIEETLKDDSVVFIEEARNKMKSRGQPIKVEENVKNMKRVYSSADIHRKVMIVKKKDKQEMPKRQPEHYQDQDIVGPDFAQEEQKQHEMKNSQLILASGHMTERPRRRRISVNTMINIEQKVLPKYSKTIINNNHKDLMKKLYQIRQNGQKFDRDEMIKHLALKQEKNDKIAQSAKLSIDKN